jgi:hypothetical protein
MTFASKPGVGPRTTALYTVIVGFDDFTQGIEQFEATSPEDAMAKFLRDAECLRAIAPESRRGIDAAHIKLLTLVKMRRVWLWLRAQSQVPGLPSLLGGQIIQTDRSARPTKGAR